MAGGARWTAAEDEMLRDLMRTHLGATFDKIARIATEPDGPLPHRTYTAVINRLSIITGRSPSKTDRPKDKAQQQEIDQLKLELDNARTENEALRAQITRLENQLDTAIASGKALCRSNKSFAKKLEDVTQSYEHFFQEAEKEEKQSETH